MSRTLLICRTLHQDKYSFQVFASWILNVSFIEILQTCYKQSLHSIWMSFTTYLKSYLEIWRPVHFWRPAMVLRYTFCFDPYCPHMKPNSITGTFWNFERIIQWIHWESFRSIQYICAAILCIDRNENCYEDVKSCVLSFKIWMSTCPRGYWLSEEK